MFQTPTSSKPTGPIKQLISAAQCAYETNLKPVLLQKFKDELLEKRGYRLYARPIKTEPDIIANYAKILTQNLDNLKLSLPLPAVLYVSLLAHLSHNVAAGLDPAWPVMMLKLSTVQPNSNLRNCLHGLWESFNSLSIPCEIIRGEKWTDDTGVPTPEHIKQLFYSYGRVFRFYDLTALEDADAVKVYDQLRQKTYTIWSNHLPFVVVDYPGRGKSFNCWEEVL